MKRWLTGGLYRTLALTLLVSLAAMSAVAWAIAVFGGARAWEEWLERSHLQVPALLANDAAVRYRSAGEEGVRELFAEARRVNPRLFPVLLRSNGDVWIAPAGARPLTRPVPHKLLRRFSSPELPTLPVYGPAADGSADSRPVVISPALIGGERGFLYLTITDPYPELLATSRGRQNVFVALMPTFFSAAIVLTIGFIGAMYYISARLRRLAVAASRIAGGDYETLVPVDSADTIGQLAERFNEMCRSILEQDRDLAERETRRKRLLATVAHDLRTPLSVIRGFIELMQERRGLIGGPESRNAVATVQRNVARQRELFRDLESLSELEFGRSGVELTSIDLARVVNDIVDAYRPSAESSGVAISAETPAEAVVVEGSRLWLDRMLMNLVTNALRYTAAGGRITLALAQTERAAVLRVTDTGIGIPAEALPRIFEDFYRVRRDSGADPGGTGLGLSIVKRAVELQRGTIRAESAEGAGTTFVIEIPRLGHRPADAIDVPVDGTFPARSPAPTKPATRKREWGAPLSDWEDRALGRLLLASVGLYVCVGLTVFHQVAALPWFAGMLMVAAAVRGSDRALIAGLFIAPVSSAITSDSRLTILALALVVLGLLLSVRRVEPSIRRVVLVCFVYGVLAGGACWLMLERLYPQSVFLIALGCTSVLYSLAFLSRTLIVWSALAAPFLVQWIGTLLLRHNFETPLLGFFSGSIVGVLMLSTHFDRRARLIEVRLMTFFVVALTIMSFVQSYVIWVDWVTRSNAAGAPELIEYGRELRNELIRATSTDSPEDDKRLMESVMRYRPSLLTIRYRDIDTTTGVGGFVACVPFECTPRLIVYRRGLYEVVHREQNLDVMYDPRSHVYHLLVRGQDGQLLFVGRGTRDIRPREILQLYVAFAMLILGGGIVLTATLVRAVLERVLTRRLQQLEAVMGDLERGDDSARATLGPLDEIGRLEQALNAMAEARAARRAALARADAARQKLIEAIVSLFRAPMAELEQTAAALSSADSTGDLRLAELAVRSLDDDVRRNTALVDDLFTLSRLENCDVPIADDPIDVAELLFELRDELGHDALSISVLSKACSMMGDLAGIRRALMRLIADLRVVGEGRVNAEVGSVGGSLEILLATEGSAVRSSAHDPADAIDRAIVDRTLQVHRAVVSESADGSAARISFPRRREAGVPTTGA